MHNLLAGKNGIISGLLDENSLAYHIALKCREEGGKIVVTNTGIGARLGKVKEICQQWNVPFLQADLTLLQDIDRLLDEAISYFGGKIDFFLHSVAMSLNIRKNRDYCDLDYDFMQKTIDISAISLHKFLSRCYKKDAIKEWGSVVTISYIASQRTFPGYNDMSEAKAMLEAIVRNFGYYYGRKRKVRINAISQSPTPTTAGSSIPGFDIFYKYAGDMSPLGNAPADACANLCVFLFSDLSRYITMQTIYCDGGFHATGISDALIEKIKGQI